MFLWRKLMGRNICQKVWFIDLDKDTSTSIPTHIVKRKNKEIQKKNTRKVLFSLPCHHVQTVVVYDEAHWAPYFQPIATCSLILLKNITLETFELSKLHYSWAHSDHSTKTTPFQEPTLSPPPVPPPHHTSRIFLLGTLPENQASQNQIHTHFLYYKTRYIM